ncbi:MAG TPA: TIR domain-containing protein, partial [Pyrinomonadaceae bacterium]|nr:TIR domain-containing protein [Pyrinomonadaceae bacterium]
MSNSYVFISHSSKDDAFVKELRAALEDQGLSVWADSRNLRGGAKLTPEIEEAITGARQVLVVISPQTVNSPWVRREIKRALDVEQQRGGEGYKVIPLLLPGIEFSALSFWFDDEPVGARAGIEVGELGEALPGILAALGARSPDGARSIQESPPRLVAELKLRLKDARFEQIAEGVRRVTATAQLSYDPADASRSAAESGEFKFTAPRGQIEAEDLRWYLESYYLWPVGVFIERARRIEAQLPLWGRDLYEAATADKSAQKLLADWHQADEGIERRFSIIVDGRTPEAVGKEEAASDEAASALLSLPWELLHDGRSYLFHGKHPVRVRRCLAKERSEPPHPTSLPIRILLVSPRPEDKSAAYTDHRASALPLVGAFESLGSLVDLKVLTPPTFPALQAALREASGAGKPFHVVHFDGHSVYDREHGLSALCFEGPQDAEKLEGRRSELVYASKPQDKPASDKKYLADLVREHHIPLVFLGAGRGATTEEIPAASVAAALLEEGVASVVAMSHGVLTETARRFFEAFYKELAQGQRVGTAMLAAQRALHDDTWRGKVMGAGDLFLQDWSVPVLYQIEQDPQLITKLPPRAVRQLQAEERRLSFGYLPGAPPHGFHGRSRE